MNVLPVTVSEPPGLKTAPPRPATPVSEPLAWSLLKVSFVRVNVPLPFEIPAPLLALPLAIVRPEIVTFRPSAVTPKTPLVPPPLTVRSSRHRGLRL